MASLALRDSFRRRVSKWTAMSLLCQQILWTPVTLAAENPVVVGGGAAIVQNGTNLNVTTQTDRTIINWDQFNVAAGHSANFYQPSSSSAVLNRVVTQGNPSAIYGNLFSNGNVYLVNPSGIVVGPTGTINTNGFTASVLDIANRDFMAGGPLNFEGNSVASILNQGTISTGAGGATLIGNQVINEGLIESKGGSINLLTGGSVQLRHGGIYTQADQKTVMNGISETAALIRNSGTLRATGGLEIGGDVYLVSPGGTILQEAVVKAAKEATGGKVVLDSGAGKTTVTGQIDVSGPVGGQVAITGKQTELQGARIEASGTNGGGTVKIGGGFQGKDATVANSRSTVIDRDTQIIADALISGDGGQVFIWSDGSTRHFGSVSAKGARLGQGGFVEVSGKESLVYQGQTRTGGGTLLLDPYDYIIDCEAAETISLDLGDNNVIVLTTENNTSYGSTGEGTGNVTVKSSILWNSGNSLTLLAVGDIVFEASVQNSGSGDLNVVAGWDQSTGICGASPFDLSAFVSIDVLNDCDVSAFGNNGHSVFIGGASHGSSLAVGSAHGSTNVFAHDLVLRGSDTAGASAQLGYYRVAGPEAAGTQITSGDIRVALTGGLTGQAGAIGNLSPSTSYVQIGHGGNRVGAGSTQQWDHSGDIDITVKENLLFSAGSGEVTYALLGHGGAGNANLSGDYSIEVGGSITFQGGSGTSSSAHLGHFAVGNHSGDHSVVAWEDVSFIGGSGLYAVAQFGNGGPGATGNDSGNLLLGAGGNLLLQGGSNSSYAQIGHGDALNQFGGLASGDIYVSAAGESSLVNGSSTWRIGHGTATANGVSDSNIFFSTGTLDYSATNETAATQTVLNQDFIDKMVTNLKSGHVAIGSTNQTAGETGGMVVGSKILSKSSNSLSLLSRADIRFQDHVQLSGSGDLNVVAGWYGFAGFDFDGDSGRILPFNPSSLVIGGNHFDNDYLAFGLDSGSIYIGSADQTKSISVGSAFGDTNVFAHDLVLRGSDSAAASAQLGYYHVAGQPVDSVVASGDIRAFLTGDLNATAGSEGGWTSSTSYVQIGHGGNRGGDFGSRWDYQGDIGVFAMGDVSLQAGSGDVAYALIGHGGGWANTNATGDIGVYTAGDVNVVGGSGASSFAQIGHLGAGETSGDHLLVARGDISFKAGGGAYTFAKFGNGGTGYEGTHSGDLILHTQSDLLLQGGVDGTAFAQIGNGDALNVTEGSISGDILILVEDETSLAKGESRWRIGHGTATPFGISDANITFLTGTLDQMSFNDKPAKQTVLDQEFMSQMALNLEGGHVTVGSLNQNRGSRGGMVVQGEIDVQTSNSLSLLSRADIRFENSVQNAGNGDLNVVAGWNGIAGLNLVSDTFAPFDPTSLLEVNVMKGHWHPFGQKDGSVYLGSSNQSTGVAVGSAHGRTNVFAEDLVLRGSDSSFAYAQLGYHHTEGGDVGHTIASGDLNVALTGSLTAKAGSTSLKGLGGSSSYVQIGHGGNRLEFGLTDAWNYEGNISIAAAGDINFQGGRVAGSYALLGHGGFGTVGNLNGNMSVAAKDDISFTAGSGSNAFAQLGHGGLESSGSRQGDLTVFAGDDVSFRANNNQAYAQLGHTSYQSDDSLITCPVIYEFGGNIQLSLGGQLKLDGGSSHNIGAAIGHGGIQNSTLINQSVSGDIKIWIGEGAELKAATIGHQQGENGAYASGNTWIAVEQKRSSSKLEADRHSQFVSAESGELRFYLPYQRTLAVSDKTLFNGVQGKNLKNELGYLKNRQGDYQPFTGPYDIDSSLGNFGFYIEAIGLLVQANNGSSTYGDTGVTNPGMSLMEGSESLKEGDTLTGIGLRTNFDIDKWTDAGTYSLKVNGYRLDSDYELIGTSNGIFTVNKANLVITPKDQSKTYGDSLTLDQTKFSIYGLKNDDKVSQVTLSSSGTSAGADAGKYDIKATGIAKSSSFKASNYNITYKTNYNGLTVNKANLVITPKDQSKTYGDSLTLDQTKFSIYGLKNDDKVSKVYLSSTGTSAGADAGKYDIKATGIAKSSSFKASNYNITYKTNYNGLTVNKANLVITPKDQSKTYGDSLTLDQTKFSIYGLKNDDQVSKVYLSSHGTSEYADAGKYDIKATGIAKSSSFKSSNYHIIYKTNHKGLTVNKANLVITPTSQSKTYGDAFNFNGTEFTIVGLKNNDKVTGVELTSAGSAASANVGSYDITAVSITQSKSFKSSNYNIDFGTLTDGFTVNKADLTITPTSQNKTYGDTFTFNGTEFTIQGLKNGNTVTGVTLSSDGTNVLANVGSYDIVSSAIVNSGNGFDAGNYNIDFGTLTNGLIVNKAELVITPTSQNKTYGDTFTFNGTEFTIQGLKNGNTVTGVTLSSDGSNALANVGSYAIVSSAIVNSGNGFDANNYNIDFGTLTDGFTVNKADLTITPTSQNKTYGDTFTFNGTEFTIEGLKNGNTVTGVTLSSDGTNVLANVDNYDIVSSAITNSGNGFDANNYNIDFGTLTDGFTVNKADLTITPTSQNKTYGDTFTFNGTEFTIQGLKNGNTVTGVTLSSDGTNVLANAGNYDIVSSAITNSGNGFDASNYNIDFGTLTDGFTVNKANLTITPNSQVKNFDQQFVFNGTEFTVVGLKNGDQVNTVAMSSEGTPQLAPLGTYDTVTSAITGSTQFNPENYNVTLATLVNGFVVIPADVQPEAFHLESLAEDMFDRPENYFHGIQNLTPPQHPGEIRIFWPETEEEKEQIPGQITAFQMNTAK